MDFKYKKISMTCIIVILLFSIINPNVLSFNNYTQTNLDDLSYKQEIDIPIDTSLAQAKYQAIDVKIVFNNPCWAKDDISHSVRVGFDDGNNINEIESQIYSLEFTDDYHISSCNLVFLIPKEADGKEKYFVFYDSKETVSPEYDDHVELYDSSYYYEPISGQKIFFDYYGFREEGFVIYAVVQKGELIGFPIAHSVAKFLPGSTEVETNNVDQLSNFDMRYGFSEEPGYKGPSWATQVKKQVLVDGNLMGRVRVETISPEGNLKTDNIYTYYYSPTDTKRIFVDINNEILETITIEDTRLYDGTYCGIVSPKSRSATIDKMNIGDILPNLVLYNENDIIEDFSIPPNPDSTVEEEILSTDADIDLGEKAWAALTNPSTGLTHALIVNSNENIIDGIEDGLQVKAFVKQNLKLPGLEADTGNMFIGRNAYDSDRDYNPVMQKGLNISMNVEYITIEKEGHSQLNDESDIFQELVKQRPSSREYDTKDEDEEKERYKLTAYAHFAPSFPMGAILSAVSGKNRSYISAELYKDNSFKSSGSVGRLSLGNIDLDFEGKKLIEILKMLFNLFDWRNTSLFKRIIFPDVEPGIYVIKIFRENIKTDRTREYIGYSIVDIRKNTRVNIRCKSEGTLQLKITDQKDNGVENTKFLLLDGNQIIADTISDENGKGVIYAPINIFKNYKLQTIYQGFLIDEKNIKLGLTSTISPEKETFKIDKYQLKINVKDKWDFAPSIDLNPTLTSSKMIEPITIKAEKIDNGKYLFNDLYGSYYNLTLRYKSFIVEENIEINNDNEINLVFPAEYKIDANIMNQYGENIKDKKITIKRNNKQVEKTIDENGKASFNVPPGVYELTVYSDDEEIAKQKIDLRADKKIDILSKETSLLHTIILILGILLILFSLFIMCWKKLYFTGLKLIIIAIILIAVFLPWWSLYGEEDGIETNTNVLLIPGKIVTLTETSNAIGGDVSQVPDEVTMVLELLSTILFVTILIIFTSIIIHKRFPKTSFIISLISFILLIAVVGIFFYAMSQLTEVGVGSFIGSGDIDTTIPGEPENVLVNCSWGPSLGFYLVIISFIVLFVTFFQKKIMKRKS